MESLGRALLTGRESLIERVSIIGEVLSGSDIGEGFFTEKGLLYFEGVILFRRCPFILMVNTVVPLT